MKPRSSEREQQFRKLWDENVSVRDIAAQFRISPASVYNWANRLGLPRRNIKSGPKPIAGRKVAERDPTGQRRFLGIVSEGPRFELQPHHPAARKAATIFPTQVRPARMVPRLLKSGEHSRKLGVMVLKGRWTGFPIYSLTLEERDTCPRSCQEWLTCYGNNMHAATRILDDGTLIRRLWGELASLNAEHPRGFVVRLHVLGDFYSVDYVRFWREALDEFPALNVFGFTARNASDPIGRELMELVAHRGERFMMRFSGWDNSMMASEVVSEAGEARYIVCPAEKNEKRFCGNCALCFNSLTSITFIRH